MSTDVNVQIFRENFVEVAQEFKEVSGSLDALGME